MATDDEDLIDGDFDDGEDDLEIDEEYDDDLGVDTGDDLDGDDADDADADDEGEGEPASGATEEEEDDEEEVVLDEDEEDEEEEEASLDALLRDKVLDDDLVGEDVRDVGPASISDGEFTCRSCFLVKRQAQLADEEQLICFDCA